MSVEAWTITPEYTISGTGPYAITHPYADGAIRAYVRLDTGLLLLNGAEFSVSPVETDMEGNLTLSPTVATTHAGRKLIIDRITPDEQGWLAVQGEREAGLAAQLDRMVQANQELRQRGAGALRIRGVLDAFDWIDGTVPILDGTRVKSGPTAAEIVNAQLQAIAASASAAAAAASAAAALAKENSMLAARGTWATATLYKPSDIVRQTTAQYRCLVQHTSGVFATDLAAARWEVWLQDGAAGPGSGNMLKSENLSGLTDYPLARATMGLGAMATKSGVDFADLAAGAVRTAAEGLATPTDTELATIAWAKAYADTGLPWTTGSAVSIASGASANVALPSTAREIVLDVNNLSTNGNDPILQFLEAGTPKAAGYNASGLFDYGNHVRSTTSFYIRIGGAVRAVSGKAFLRWDAGLGFWRYEHFFHESTSFISTSTGWGFCTPVLNLSGLRLSVPAGLLDGVGGTIQATYR